MLTGWTFIDSRPLTPWSGKNKCSALERRGADVQSLPLLELVPMPDNAALIEVVEPFRDGDFLVFTSGNAIRFALAQLPAAALEKFAIAVIGAKTAAVLHDHGLRPQFVSTDANSAAFGEELAALIRARRDRPSVLLLRGRLAGAALPAALRPAAAQLVERPIYDAQRLIQSATAKARWRAALSNPNCVIMVTSSESVRALAGLLDELQVSKRTADSLKLAAIGPETTQTISEYKLPLFLEAEARSFETLQETLIKQIESAAAIH